MHPLKLVFLIKNIDSPWCCTGKYVRNTSPSQHPPDESSSKHSVGEVAPIGAVRCRCTPLSLKRMPSTSSEATYAACLYLPDDRHHVGRIPLGREAHSTTAPDFMVYPGVR
jgi:hypothetical protein